MGVVLRAAVALALLLTTAPSPSVATAAPPEEWRGTIDVTEDGAVSLIGSMTFTAAPDGTITGSGNGEYGAPDARRPVDLVVSGARLGDSVDLVVVAAERTFEATLPLRGAVAEGPYRALGQRSEYPKGWLRLVCISCLTAETWTGSVTYDQGANPSIPGVMLSVGPGGTVTGSGSATYEALDVQSTTEVAISGTRRLDSFELTLVATGADHWTVHTVVPIDGAEAHGASDVPPKWKVDLTCLNCA